MRQVLGLLDKLRERHAGQLALVVFTTVRLRRLVAIVDELLLELVQPIFLITPSLVYF